MYMTYASWAEKVNVDAAKMVCTVTAELMKLHNHSKKALYDQIRTLKTERDEINQSV